MPTWLASRSTDETAPPPPVITANLGSVCGLPCHPWSLPVDREAAGAARDSESAATAVSPTARRVRVWVICRR